MKQQCLQIQIDKLFFFIQKPLMNKKKQSLKNKQVHKFTQNALMKFRPISIFKQQSSQSNKKSIYQSLISFFRRQSFNIFQKQKQNSQNVSLEQKVLPINNRKLNKSAIAISQNQQQNKDIKLQLINSKDVEFKNLKIQSQSQQTNNKSSQLKYLQKLSADSFMIGNQNQLDMISIVGVLNDTIETQLNWSLSILQAILGVAIDEKRGYISLQTKNGIHIYQYDTKKIKNQPIFITRLNLAKEPKIILFLKDSLLGIFFHHSSAIYLIEDKSVKIMFNKNYNIPTSLILIQIPKPVQNLVNIFFKQQSKENSNIFSLWRLELVFRKEIDYKALSKIYDIPKIIQEDIKLINYCKDIFLININSEIIVAKNGYIIDSVNTNIQQKDNFMIYLDHNVYNINHKNLEIYKFQISYQTRPQKILIQSIDSICIKKPLQYEYFDSLKMINNNLVVFYQIKGCQNKKLNGEVEYLICLAQNISIQQKLNQIFCFKNSEQLLQLARNSFELIQQKCDMAFKLGLTQQQVFLKLWDKSDKKDIQSYKFLLDTRNYETIKHEIEKKLKKSAIYLSEVYKIQQGCLSILQRELRSSSCSQKSIKDYIYSHFFLQKLQYFRELLQLRSKCQEMQNKKITINIQQHSELNKMELKSTILQYFSQMCFQNKNVKEKIRLFIEKFKFALRLFYLQLLKDLIILAKDRLAYVLRQIPQILPIKNQYQIENEGIWGNISELQWQKNLYIKKLVTMYNQSTFEIFQKSLWFKRYLYSNHNLTTMTRQEILNLHQANKSENTFYYLLDILFEFSKLANQQLKAIILILESYDFFPQHLKGKVFLYQKLFKYFQTERDYSKAGFHLVDNNLIKKLLITVEGFSSIDPTSYDSKSIFNWNISKFQTFLKLKESQLFKMLFNYQKFKKGCILKDVKYIYNQVEKGDEMFQKGLLDYFASELSQISDLKYILNRLNNQKRQFHLKNEGLYEILVKAIKMKLKFGKNTFTIFEQVMIYIENIPFSKKSLIIDDLKIVRKIYDERERFKRIDINMSVNQILQNYQTVMNLLINSEIQQNNIFQIQDEEKLKYTTYKILAEIQTIKQKIYKNNYSDLCFFLYLSRIMEKQNLIKFSYLLLQDSYLLDFFSVNQHMIENLVIYMYKWRFDQNPVYTSNSNYIKQLLLLLPKQNNCRIFMECELELACLLSNEQYQVQFPMIPSYSFSINEIKNIFKHHKQKFLITLNFKRIYDLTKNIQQLCIEDQTYFLGIEISQILEQVILRLLELKSLRQAIIIIKRLIIMLEGKQNYSVVYIFLVLNQVCKQLSQFHRKSLYKIAYYTAQQPFILIQILQNIINSKFSHEEEEHFLSAKLAQLAKNYKCYNLNNILLERLFVQKIVEQENQFGKRFQELIFLTFKRISNNRDDYQKNEDYTLLYILAIKMPYAVCKYIFIRRYHINLRILRSFFSYLYKQDIFNGKNVLMFMKRVIYIVLESIKSLSSIEVVASQYKNLPFSNDEFVMEFQYIQDGLENSLYKSILSFQDKINASIIKQNLMPQSNIYQKKNRILALLSNKIYIKADELSEYPFEDGDDTYGIKKDDFIHKQISKRQKNQCKRNFNPHEERKKLMNRNNKNIALYLSNFDHQNILSLRLRKNSKKISCQTPKDSNKKEKKLKDVFQKLQPQIQETKSNGFEKIKSESALIFNQSQIYQQREESLIFKLSPRSRFFNREIIDQKLNEVVFDKDGQTIKAQNIDKKELKICIKQIDEALFTSAPTIIQRIFKDYDDGQIFDLSCLTSQEEREGSFKNYLHSLIEEIYNNTQCKMSLRLKLINQILQKYPIINYSKPFLEIYFRLQNYHSKQHHQYNQAFPICAMFPISGIFILSNDPKQLYQFAKQNILNYIDENNIHTISLIIRKSFQDSTLQEKLVYSYLSQLVERYNRNVQIQETPRLTQKIQALLDKVRISTLLMKGEQLILKVSEQKNKQFLEILEKCFAKKQKIQIFKQLIKKIQMNL